MNDKSEIKIIDLVRHLLTNYPELRNSDKKLIWEFWRKEGKVFGSDGLFSTSTIDYNSFLSATHPESIRRSAAEIRSEERAKADLNPDYLNSKDCLLGSADIEAYRKEKEAEKGTFIYREKTNIK